MPEMTLTKTRLTSGVWEGELTGAGPDRPQILATHLGESVGEVSLTARGDIWEVRIPVPTRLISDGVQTVVISQDGGPTLGSFALMSGEVLAEDIRAELSLLRGELDMLKKSFRRHCSEI